jgi:hypothetical protein
VSDSVIPVTQFKDHISGVLPTNSAGIGQIKNEIWSSTRYSEGNNVTDIVVYTYIVNLYDSSAKVKEYNLPNKLDIKV